MSTRVSKSTCLHCFWSYTGFLFLNALMHLIKYQLPVLVFSCLHNMAPEYLARDLQWASDTDSRQRLSLLSSSSQQLIVPSTKLYTVSDCAFAIAAACIWNSLPSSYLCCNSQQLQQTSQNPPISMFLPFTVTAGSDYRLSLIHI